MKKNEEITDKSKTLLKLILYVLFIVVFMIIASPGRAKKNETTNENASTPLVSATNVSYIDKQSKLKDGTYNYRYEISGEVNTMYHGKCQANVCEGVREIDGKSIKYTLINWKAYIKENGEDVEYDAIYENLDGQLFDYTELFKILNSAKSLKVKKDNEEIYTYENINNYEVIVSTNDETIYKIEIKGNNLDYKFNFEY